MPRVMSDEVAGAFGQRLAEYHAATGIGHFAVILHGGEPLLAGAGRIAEAVGRIRSLVPSGVKVDFGLQTNGLLLDDTALDILEAADISVSLSLDGPRRANDLHRTSSKGRSSFDRTLKALERLRVRPAMFSGVIAVIDPRVPASELLEFFGRFSLPKLDFLLPDANHDRQPPGRAEAPDLYARWLIDGFDAWFDHYPETPVRLFEAVLDAVAGLPSGTDAFGTGDVSLLTVETDGSWHDLDVLKVASHGATKLEGSVFDTSIAEVAASPRLSQHRQLLSLDGLADKCRSCAEAEVCGGGAVPHRFGGDGFDNPTVYCEEMKALLAHVRRRLQATVQSAPPAAPPQAQPVRLPFTTVEFELAENAVAAVTHLLGDAGREASGELADVVRRAAESWPEHRASADSILGTNEAELQALALWPGAVAWRKGMLATFSGHQPQALDGSSLPSDPGYMAALASRLRAPVALTSGDEDRWLRFPFGQSIVFDGHEHLAASQRATRQALAIVSSWRPSLADELHRVCRTVQFIQDPTAHPDKIVSFSDNSVPGALFVSMRPGGALLDPYDLADSLIHEHRHQKLYLLERLTPMVLPGAPRVASPWREEPRPVTGLLHAVFVFVELRRFWAHVLENGPTRISSRARNQLADTDERLAEGTATLRTCPLTDAGREMLEVLDAARLRTPAAAA